MKFFNINIVHRSVAGLSADICEQPLMPNALIGHLVPGVTKIIKRMLDSTKGVKTN